MVVNFDVFPDYIRELQRRYDPKKDVVVRGHCVRYGAVMYPQGGSGAIFSRAASALLARDHELMVSRWAESEDITLGVYMRTKGISVPLTADPHFLGIGWRNVDRFNKVVNRPEQGCPVPQSNRTDCERIFVSPLRKIVFYHSATNEEGMDGHFQVAKRLFRANKSIMWYPESTGHTVKMCLPIVQKDGQGFPGHGKMVVQA
jgi:hypothetical protein